jgi:hypothetical protein
MRYHLQLNLYIFPHTLSQFLFQVAYIRWIAELTKPFNGPRVGIKPWEIDLAGPSEYQSNLAALIGFKLTECWLTNVLLCHCRERLRGPLLSVSLLTHHASPCFQGYYLGTPLSCLCPAGKKDQRDLKSSD